jgi:tetratricopeptide (TPR) repeat protein
MAERAIALAERLDARELLGPAHGRLSQAYAMRGDAGDLDRAKETGDKALEIWIPAKRTDELAEHNFMHAHTHYWIGRFDRALELSRAARELAVHSGSREALLRGGALEGASLAAMGRYEEALSVFDERIALGRELGRPVRVLLNYSTAALRDVYDLDEARRRNEEALEQLGWSSFNMPWQNALVDLVFNDLLAGDIAGAEARWPKVWDDVRAGKAWQRWFLVGKMAAARAEIALHTNRIDEAAEWAQKAIDMAVPVGRLKYETIARIILAEALLALGRMQEADAGLRKAVSDADRLGSPPERWKARAALGRVFYSMGRDDEAERAFHEASDVIQAVADGLSEERADRFLNAAPVLDVLKAAR